MHYSNLYNHSTPISKSMKIVSYVKFDCSYINHVTTTHASLVNAIITASSTLQPEGIVNLLSNN